MSPVYYVTKMDNMKNPKFKSVFSYILTLIGFSNHVDDLGGLQGELVSLLGHVLFHTLDLRTV